MPKFDSHVEKARAGFGPAAKRSFEHQGEHLTKGSWARFRNTPRGRQFIRRVGYELTRRAVEQTFLDVNVYWKLKEPVRKKLRTLVCTAFVTPDKERRAQLLSEAQKVLGENRARRFIRDVARQVPAEAVYFRFR